MKRTFLKKVVTLFLALFVIAGSFGIIANAAQEELGGVNGYLIPTDINLSAPKTEYAFYGDSAYLYFMLFSMGKADSFYNIEIFSKSDYSSDSAVVSYVSEYGKKGNMPLRLNWPFKANPSGTYYGRCYTTIIKGEEEVIDTSTIYKFTIHLNRIGKSEVPLVSVANSKKGVVVKWDKLATATKYRIYRKTKGASSWSKVADVNGNTTSYTDTKVKSGTQYSYTVKAFDKLYSSLYDKTGLKTIYLSTPTLTAPKASTSVYPVVKWSQVAGCNGYYIYRKGGSLSDSNKWKRIATVKNPKTHSYTDKTATSADWEYSYTVRAYYVEKVKKYNKNNKPYYENVVHLSSYDSKGATYNCATAPILKTATSAYGGIQITWLDTNTAKKKFYIYRKAAGETKWTTVGSSTTPSFIDKKVSNGVTYTYTVRTATATNLSAFDKKGISTKYVLTPTLKKLTIASNGTTTLTWSSVPGAKGYVIYKSTNGNKWAKLATIKNAKTVTYKDTAAKASGSTYSYTVRAYNGSYYSSYVKSGLSTMYLTAPKVTAKNDYSNEQGSSVKLTWNSVTGAKSYRIYRKTASDKSWSVIADNFTGRTYYDKTAKSGAKYYYQ
ncbi:MAG: hypothetical protein IKC01_02265 [Clostridia bacterium]|nr:hypothetical protein [Clostridia bacterium]